MEGRREDPERRNLRMRAGQRRARREPAEDDAFGTGGAQHLVVSGGAALQGHPVPEVERELEAVRHDADDGVHGLAEPQLASDDVSRAGETPLPDVVADDDDGGGAGRQVGVDDTRPISGGTLATRNPAAEISATAASSTDPSTVMTLRRIVWKAPTSSTDCRLPRQRSMSCHGVSRR